MKKIISKKILLLLSVLMILLVTVGCSKEVKTKLTPAEHVNESIEATLVGNIDITADVDFELDYQTLSQEETFADVPESVVAILNELSMKANYKVKSDLDNETLDFVMDYDINYKSNPLLSTSMIFNNEVFGMGFTNFYDKYFVVDFKTIANEVMKQATYQDFSQIDFEKYIQIILSSDSDAFKKLQENETYSNMIKAHLDTKLDEGVNEEITYLKGDEEVTENVLTYTYDFDFESYFTLFIDLIKEVQQDEDAKVYAKEVITAVMTELLESGDYKALDTTEEEMLMMKELIETDFETGWNDLFDELLAEYDDMDSLYTDLGPEGEEIMAAYDSLDYKISINKENIIRKVSVSMDYSGFKLNMNYIINAIGDDVVIESREDKYINLLQFVDFENPEELQNKEELATIIKEFLVSSINELISGEGYTALFEDLKPLEEEFGLTISEITTYLEMGKVYIENMSVEEIVAMIEDNMPGASYDYDYDYEDDTSYDTQELAPLDHIAFIMDKPLNQSEINDAMWQAVQEQGDMNYASYTSYLSTIEDVTSNMQEAIDQGADLIFINGEEFADAVSSMAELFPEVHFVVLSGYPFYYGTNLSILDYYNEETAYVAGTVAALTSETGKIGFIGGINDIYTQNYEISFRDGALAANPEIILESRYAESMTDYTLGETIAAELNSLDVDVIYHYAGSVGNAVITDSEKYGYKFIGNESLYGSELPGYITSTLRNYDFIVNNIVTDYTYGYVSDYYSYGIYDDALYLPTGNIGPIVNEQKELIVDQIKSGELYIPTYYGE